MSESVDVCVLGSGAVGQSVAHRARKAGLSVVVIEAQTPGGTCPNRGCDAKKPYVNAAALRYRSERLHAAGGGIEPASIAWRDITQFKRRFTEPVGGITGRELADVGAEVIIGSPKFLDASTIEVGDRRLSSERIVIATGHQPRELNIPGIEHTVNSDALLEIDDLPPRVAFIGGGYIGMEFACAAAHAGHEVTVLNSREHTLQSFDPFVVGVMEEALPQLGPHGVRVITNARVGAVTPADGGGFVVHRDADGTQPLVEVDLVVNSSGRVPSVAGLNLEAAGVEHSPAGVHVDEFLRCPGNPRVWAGGDVADNGRPGLIPTAVDDGRILAHNMVAATSEADMRRRSNAPLCSVAFTTPMVAGAGMTEAEAREQHGDAVHVSRGRMNTKKFFRELGQEHIAYTLVFGDDRTLLGAHFTGEGADEVINLFGLALGHDAREHALHDMTLTYPSIGSALQGAYRKAVAGL
ncbi:MAG: NAD(P)/FAD-dependent oxidoreductase [Phycisphaerales bacterium]